MEIKLLAKINEKEELNKMVSALEKEGFILTRHGGGTLSIFSGWYAELKTPEDKPNKSEDQSCE